MTGNEYQVLAMRTAPAKNFNTDTDRLYHGVFGLNAEAGEVASILQKEYQGHKFDVEHMAKELGDCLWMIAECATALGVNLDSIMEINIDKLAARYPDGFDEYLSLHRAKGDI